MSSSEQQNQCSSGMEDRIYPIPPYYYLHVLDQTKNVARVECGPKTYIRPENERVILGPSKMVIVPPRHYCIVKNPVTRVDEDEETTLHLMYNPLGWIFRFFMNRFRIMYVPAKRVKLRQLHGDFEVRLEQDPFPLYPGEKLCLDVKPLPYVPSNVGLRLKAVRDFTDGKRKRVAGDEWLVKGPGTYVPRKEVAVVEKVKATTIKPNQALKLRARIATKDREGKKRVSGEEWIVKKIGAYLPGAYEEIVGIVNAYVLTEKQAVHVMALKTFVDDFGKTRKNGEEWLITVNDTETYIPGVYESVVGVREITTLNNREYCVVLDPVGPDGKPQLGKKKLIEGEKSFFLFPGESLESGIQDVYVLGENEGLILRCEESFTDKTITPPVQRSPGDCWMIKGPVEYIPPIEVEVVTTRYAIPLDENEGIYVRNVITGKIRSVCGETYMLNQDEELWNKDLPPQVLELLNKGHDPLADRGTWRLRSARADANSMSAPADEAFRVITFRVPHNAAVQVYDYKAKKSRVIFGPDLVMLGPDEQFTQLSLSGDKPKRPNVIRSVCLLLGPDFCTDIITVETGDHARLSLQLAYNWHFDLQDRSDGAAKKIFSVPDFIGDMCKAIASRIRGAVASLNFDYFHKNSAEIIHTAVFGIGENNKARPCFIFPQNSLVITSVDIQSVEPVDQQTRYALQKSVQLAIEITTRSQEAAARHEAERREQQAKGRLECQRISDELETEGCRKMLLELKASSMAVEICGQFKADALSKAEAERIESEAAVEQAKRKAEAQRIKAEAELERLEKARQSELRYIKERNELEISKKKQLAEIEMEKFKNLVSSLGVDTIQAVAVSGPEMQVKLLRSLGIQSTLITDGRNPINLFSTAKGLLGNALPAAGGRD